MAEPRRLKPGWVVLGALALAAAAWFGGPALARRLAFFQVRRIEVAGARFLPADTVVRAMGVARHASIVDPTEPYEARLAKLPGVASATVSRRLPGTLKVELVEVAPVALAPRSAPKGEPQGEGLVMIDAAGRRLPYDPARTAPDLPVAAAADSLVARLLGRMRELAPGSYARVSAAWRQQDDVVLEVGGRRLLFTPDASAEEIRAVMAVAEELGRRNRSYRELDGRFAGQVVVRGIERGARGGA